MMSVNYFVRLIHIVTLIAFTMSSAFAGSAFRKERQPDDEERAVTVQRHFHQASIDEVADTGVARASDKGKQDAEAQAGGSATAGNSVPDAEIVEEGETNGSKDPAETSPLLPSKQEVPELNLKLLKDQINAAIARINGAPDQYSIEVATALKSYNPNQVRGKWDNLDDFLKHFDEAFFKTSGLKIKVVRGLGLVCLGWESTFAITGLTLSSIGDFLQIPIIGDVTSGIFQGWFVGTVAPVSMRQVYARVGKIANIFCQDRRFTVDEGGEKSIDSRPHIFKKSKKEIVTLIPVGGAAVLRGLVPMILMLNAYKNLPAKWFPYGSAPFVLHFFADNYWELGKERMRKLFSHYSYTETASQRLKRAILLRRVEQFQECVADSTDDGDKFVMAVYEIIRNKIRVLKSSQGVPEDEVISALSALLFKEGRRDLMSLSKEPKEAGPGSSQELQDPVASKRETDLRRKLADMEEENFETTKAATKLTNFKVDLDTTVTHSAGSDFLRELSKLVIGAGMYGRFVATGYTLKMGLIGLGADPAVAEIAGYLIAGLELPVRGVIEWELHQRQFARILKVPSWRHLGDYNALRKILGAVSCINGALFSLPTLVAGLSAIPSDSLWWKIGIVTSAAILDFSLFEHHFGEQYDKIITGAAALKMENIGVERKRAQLNAWANRLKRLIQDKLSNETIENIYYTTQDGL